MQDYALCSRVYLFHAFQLLTVAVFFSPNLNIATLQKHPGKSREKSPGILQSGNPDLCLEFMDKFVIFAILN